MRLLCIPWSLNFQRNALLCATFSGDVAMVKFLAQQKADLMSRLYGLGDLGYDDDLTLLMAALETRQSPEMIRTLLEAFLGERPERFCFSRK